MRALLALALLALSASTHAADWSPTVIAEESAYQAANLLDWGTTNNIPRKQWACQSHDNVICTYGYKYREAGDVWAMGTEPSQARINQYMAASAALHLAISYALLGHPCAEQVWHLITLGAKANAVGHNFSIGLHTRF